MHISNKQIKILAIVLVCIVLLSALAYMILNESNTVTENQDGWSIESIGSGYTEEILPSKEKTDNIYLFYIDDNGSMMYKIHSGDSWSIGMPCNLPRVGSYSFALDSNNNIHASISFPGELGYAVMHNGSWGQIQILDVEAYNEIGDSFNSICLDSNNNPHIVYNNYKEHALKYASYNKDNGSWSFEVIDRIGDYTWGSMVMDNKDRPQVTYSDDRNNTLKYAIRERGVWSVRVIDTLNKSFCGGNSIAVDNLDRPHILYEATNETLKYAVWNGKDWNISVVGKGGKGVSYSSHDLVIDKSGTPHIAYLDPYSLQVRYATLYNGQWRSEVIDHIMDINSTFSGVSIFLDNNGKLDIVYSLDSYDMAKGATTQMRCASLGKNGL